jgi:hypothetical protein
METAALAHLGITHILPKKCRPYWQRISIGVSAGCVISNFSIGLREGGALVLPLSFIPVYQRESLPVWRMWDTGPSGPPSDSSCGGGRSEWYRPGT